MSIINGIIVLCGIVYCMPQAFAESGALIKVQLQSTVGIRLDDFPKSIQSRVAKSYLNKPSSFWKARAKLQIEMTLYRLIYRNSFHPQKGRLPLPPKELWNIQVTKPKKIRIDGHNLIAVQYNFSSVLVTGSSSVQQAEPRLTVIGGIWNEDFTLPVDPEFLFERTGYSCMNQTDFPPNSVDSENTKHFFDPSPSCIEALKIHVGRVKVVMNFKRIDWDPVIAQKFRQGDTHSLVPNLSVLSKGLANNRIIYRYIPKNSCAIAEGCVGGVGWRRLLQFDASVVNQSSRALALGVITPHSELVKQNMFEFSACHGHFHFSHYGSFSFGKGMNQLNSKKAFCLESTSRYSNNEQTPLHHPYNCHNQGIAAGWGDDYIAGIECQWIDVTDVKGPAKTVLEFQVNPDQFLCEGKPLLDHQGQYTFTPTEFRTETGEVKNRIACDFSDQWNKDNRGTQIVSLPARGSYVTSLCQRDEDSPLRNCGFTERGGLQQCIPGRSVKYKCQTSTSSTPVVLRVCEGSHVLGAGTACTYLESLKQVVVEEFENDFEFLCPRGRDEKEQGGNFSFYEAAAHAQDLKIALDCQRQY